ncbi:hypothetical protein [Nocardioides lianchengensis]|uniref:Uncharacterized protein n=1 Tax=Nocardioides lianchengensis TaxID=1045774 RepID=A0A1G6YWY1_9ACTN|nr:hypothetical protein [Nocardioides lianchengensis]NYG09502.1 hypothetical protein [Nocardioides lianchengensis]SDD94811.1 hypothetical protein SAMN05421872_112191 [Nocardioides lianchengensis]
MEGRIDAGVWWCRALLVAGVAFFLGVAGHVTADGLLPGPATLAVLLVFTVLLSLPLLARPASRLRLVAMTVGGQALLHLALTVSGGHVGDRAAGAAAVPRRTTALSDLPVVGGQRQGSLLDAYAAAPGGHPASTPTLPVGHLLHDLSAHAPMMAAHLAAAGLVGLWLAYGERCLWTVLALTGRRVLLVPLLVLPVLEEPARRRPVVVAPRPDLRSRWLAQPLSRRGPPLPV